MNIRKIIIGSLALAGLVIGFVPSAFSAPITLEARLTDDGSPIGKGLIWRVFPALARADAAPEPIATHKGGSAEFDLKSGTYIIHAAFGRSSAIKKITVGADPVSETFVLDAGGVSLTAVAGKNKIPPGDLLFSIYDVEQDEDGVRKLIAKDIRANRVVRLNSGTYHVVSTYGNINATVRADIEVNAGQITKAELQHRGAKVTLKLVSKAGGDPIASTSWTVLTSEGAKVFESTSVAPSLILSEGQYEASVRHAGETLVENFTVKSGQNDMVEVLIK